MSKRITAPQTTIDGVTIDENWIPPGRLAAQLGLAPSTVSNWIARGQISYVQLPSVRLHKYLVDKRTVPATSRKNAGRKPR
jgi:predicted site-specific integrase-resolvase